MTSVCKTVLLTPSTVSFSTTTMRAAAVVCIVLALSAGTNAGFFDDLLGKVLKPAHQLAQAGPQAILQLLEQGLAGVGKHGVDLDPAKVQAFLDKIKELLDEKFRPLHDVIADGYKELLQLAQNINSMSWVNKGVTKRDLHNMVDMVVGEL